MDRDARGRGSEGPLMDVLWGWGHRGLLWDGRVFEKEELWVTLRFLA